MRVLILSAILACAAAAPQFLPQVAGLQPIAVVPAVPSGDLQAATINAQVRAEDQARALADQARELTEQAVENQNEGIVEGTDLAKERTEEAFWASEDQKWQAYSAAQTAEAAIGGQLSSNDAARSLPYVAGVVPGVIAPAVSAAVAAPVAQVAQANEAENAEVKDASVKASEQSAEPEMQAAEEKNESADQKAVEVKSAAEEQAAAPEAPKNEKVDLSAYRSIVHPLPLGLAPYSYQSIIPNVGYAHAGLRTVIPIQAAYNQPIIYNNVPAFHY